MDKKTTKKVSDMQSTVKCITDNDIKTITSMLNNLADRIEQLEKKNEKIEDKSEPQPSNEEGEINILTGITSPAPTVWRNLVDKYLGADFGFTVEYPDGGKGFVITIDVPKNKSNLDATQWDMTGDKRSKVLANNAGTSGVEEFIKLVAHNLGLDN